MATATKAVLCDATIYATFAAWANWLMTNFTTFGWVQTADFGQVNWTNLATSNVVPLSSSTTTFTASPAATSISGTLSCSAASGTMVIPVAVTTGIVPGRAVVMSGLANTGGTSVNGSAGLDALIFTVTPVVASTSVTVACPTSGSSPVPWAAGFSYTTTTGTITLQPAFMLFESNDSLTSTLPIYAKLECFASTTDDVPMMRLAVGTGSTNGYGSLVTPNTTAVTMASAIAATDTANLKPCYASGDAGQFRAALFLPMGVGTSDTQRLMWFIIARSRDNSGNETGSYVMMWADSYNAAIPVAFQTVFPTGTNTEDTSGALIAALGNQTTGALSGVTYVSPVFQNVGGLSNPTPDFLVGYVKDFPNNTPAQITVYGVNHTYISVSDAATAGANPSAGAAASTADTFLLRFE